MPVPRDLLRHPRLRKLIWSGSGRFCTASSSFWSLRWGFLYPPNEILWSYYCPSTNHCSQKNLQPWIVSSLELVLQAISICSSFDFWRTICETSQASQRSCPLPAFPSSLAGSRTPEDPPHYLPLLQPEFPAPAHLERLPALHSLEILGFHIPSPSGGLLALTQSKCFHRSLSDHRVQVVRLQPPRFG